MLQQKTHSPLHSPALPRWLSLYDALPLHLAFSTLLAGLWLIRFLLTGHKSFGLFLWNLFLAWIPFFFSLGMAWVARPKPRLSLALFLLGSLWLLFFPNAPYLITDLIHLRPRNFPFWFDTLLLFGFALHGLLLGMSSLHRVHTLIHNATSHLIGWIAISLFLGLTSFGMYLGRVERWNSWDLLTQPLPTLRAITEKIFFPLHHPTAWAFTATTFLFLFISYLFFLPIHTSSHPSTSPPPTDSEDRPSWP
jgi:uncharacterized membrane protein